MNESLERKTAIKNHNRRTIFIRCSCQSEMLVLDYDGEFDIVDLSIYKIDLSYKYIMSWYQKARYIYQILRYGQPYSDQIVLDRKQINELKTFLDSI